MTKQATNHLNNVCIMQKYNDSEKVLELREEFQESEEFIKKAVNEYDNIKEGIDRRTIEIARQQAIIDDLVEALKRALDCENKNGILSIPCIEQMKQSIEKASQ